MKVNNILHSRYESIMLTMKRNKINSMETIKLEEIFTTTPGNVTSIGVSPLKFPKFYSSESTSKGTNTNPY
jgi:hypothetical protein